LIIPPPDIVLKSSDDGSSDGESEHKSREDFDVKIIAEGKNQPVIHSEDSAAA